MKLLAFFANYPASIIGIEACEKPHHWARELTKLDHEVILLNARFGRAPVVGNKTDFNDAEASYEAVRTPEQAGGGNKSRCTTRYPTGS